MPRQPAVPIIGTPIKFTMLIKTPTKKMTEVHWNNKVVALDNSDLKDECVRLATSRCKMLPSDCKMLEWWLSQENVFRDAQPNPKDAFPPGLVTETENQGNNTLPIYMSAGTQYRRTMYLGAIPDSVVWDDTYHPENNLTFKQWFASYMALLTGVEPGAAPGSSPPPANTQWGFLPRLVNDNATVPVVAIDDFLFSQNSTYFRVDTAANHACSAGDVVQISKVQHVNAQFPMNQLWLVNSVPAVNQLVLQGFPPSVIPDPIPISGGFVQKKVRTFQLYDYYATGQPSSRNRGNAAKTPKGRHKVKYNIGWAG